MSTSSRLTSLSAFTVAEIEVSATTRARNVAAGTALCSIDPMFRSSKGQVCPTKYSTSNIQPTETTNESEVAVATVIVICSTCGVMRLTIYHLVVLICEDTNIGTFSFRCPTCWITFVNRAGPEVIKQLVEFGAQSVTWRLPAELLEHHEGDPINYGDIHDFLELLQDDAAFARALKELG